MMPQTVPNRPMNGAGRADRRQHQEPPLQPLDLPRDGDVHHLLDAHLQAGEGARLALEAALPFAHGGDEQDAGGVLGLGRERFIKLLKGLAGPEGLLEMVAGLANARNSMVLSMAIAQTQTEQTSSPTMTALTIQWACQNRWNSDRFDDVNGATDCAMSPGFMERPFQRSGRPTAKTAAKPAP